MGYSIDILNNIRANSSVEYQSRIPEASRQNFSTIGTMLLQYEPLQNEFCEMLINKIGKTLIEQKMFKNPLARFKSGAITSQQDVEEIFIMMAEAEGKYDETGPNPLGRRTPPVVGAAYYRQNRQDYYAISIGDIDYIRVFRSEATLDTFIKGLINSVYSADEYDEYVCMIHLFGSFKNLETPSLPGYFDYEVPTLSSAANKEEFAKTFVKTLRKAVKDLKFPNHLYNQMGVRTWTKPEDLVLLIHKDVSVEIDVERLATAFHQSDTDLKVVPTIIDIDGFITGSEVDMTGTYALLVDKDWFRIYDTLSHMESQRNAQGLFTNYFYHHHQILALSPYKNAVRFKAVSST